MTTIHDHARSLLEDRKLFDEFSQEANNEEDSGGDEELHEEMDGDEDDNDDVEGIWGFHDDHSSLQPTFNTMRVVDDVPPHLAQSFFKIRINGQDKFIHKSYGCWVLMEENQRLSADRTKRVTQAK